MHSFSPQPKTHLSVQHQDGSESPSTVSTGPTTTTAPRAEGAQAREESGTSDPTHALLERLRGLVVSSSLAGCWGWTGRVNADQGRPVLAIGGADYLAARVMWTLARGPIPSGYEVDHVCGNRRCTNPHHLEPVTPDENRRRAREPDGVKAGRFGRRVAEVIRAAQPEGCEDALLHLAALWRLGS